MRKNEWSDKEITFLKENYPESIRDKILMNLSKRSWSAIIQKARTFNVKRTKSYKIIKKCKNCGSKFKTYIGKNNQKDYCSIKCYWNSLNGRVPLNKLHLDEDKIVKLYLKNRNSSIEIAKIIGCSSVTIINRLKKLNIKIREPSERFNKNSNSGFQKGHARYENSGAKKGGTPWNKNLTAEGDERVKKNIERARKSLTGRTLSESHRKNIGASLKGHPMYKDKVRNTKISKSKLMEKNPNWNNGSSLEPYGKEFDEKLRNRIRKRDNHICQECGMDNTESNTSLSVHHINYNKKDNNPTNLISLCVSCHGKTQKDREHWENYFRMKMFIKTLFNPQNILIFNENKQLIGVNKI